MSTDETSLITRRRATSGRVSYSDPVVIHDTSKTRIVLTPFYVDRSTGPELKAKLVTYRKTAPPNDWWVEETKSVTLDGPATLKLVAALRTMFAVADEQQDGGFVVIRLADGLPKFGDAQPAEVGSAILRVLARPEFATAFQHLEIESAVAETLHGALRVTELRSALAKLREMLEGGVVDESSYQRWCEAHSWAFGVNVLDADQVRAISAGDSLDLLLPGIAGGFREIVELKRPDEEVLLWDAAHRNFYFSAPVSKALGQTHRYLDVLEGQAENGLQDHPEIVAYHPRASVVIGRSVGWTSEKHKALHGLNFRLHGVTVMTYDHLLAQGERLLEIVTAHQGRDEADEADPGIGVDDLISDEDT